MYLQTQVYANGRMYQSLLVALGWPGTRPLSWIGSRLTRKEGQRLGTTLLAGPR
jgi:hypothetical protein